MGILTTSDVTPIYISLDMCGARYFVYLEPGTCLVATYVVLSHWREDKSAPLNPLAGFEGPLRGRGKRGEMKRRKEGAGENTFRDQCLIDTMCVVGCI